MVFISNNLSLFRCVSQDFMLGCEKCIYSVKMPHTDNLIQVPNLFVCVVLDSRLPLMTVICGAWILRTLSSRIGYQRDRASWQNQPKMDTTIQVCKEREGLREGWIDCLYTSIFCLNKFNKRNKVLLYSNLLEMVSLSFIMHCECSSSKVILGCSL